MYEYETLKPIKAILRRERKNKGGSTLYTYMEMSQRNPVYSYYKLIKTFFKISLAKYPISKITNTVFPKTLEHNSDKFFTAA
jgi:hypothetical protein